MADHTAKLVGAGILGYIVYTQGNRGTLPSGLQQWYDKYVGRTGGAPPGGGGGGSGGASACMASSIASWSAGIGLPVWVGTLFCGDNGHLPASLAELQQWGASKGYWVNGNWVQPSGS